MKHLILVSLLTLASLAATSTATARQPDNLTMTLAWVVDAGEPRQYVFVINGVVAFKTIGRLKKYVGELPRGSTLTWNPGCSRMGDEPILSSPKDMKAFKEFCESKGITFVLVPSG
jgi:hypothetical protein